MGISHAEDSKALSGYSTKYQRLLAFDITGFTKIVESGGELYDEVRSDGRWEVLRNITGDDKTIYGVASFDKDCTKGHYRYTLAVKASEDRVIETIGPIYGITITNYAPKGHRRSRTRSSQVKSPHPSYKLYRRLNERLDFSHLMEKPNDTQAPDHLTC